MLFVDGLSGVQPLDNAIFSYLMEEIPVLAGSFSSNRKWDPVS
jgi:hypothetical protein